MKTKMTPEERTAKRKAYHAEWQRNNKDKVREYSRRHLMKKAEQIARELVRNGEGGEGNEQARI